MSDLIEKFDVAIVGAGPAGSSAAIRLAKAGLSVLLVEQKRFPRDKLCGEFISPECLTHFDELGVMPAIKNAAGTDITKTVFFASNGKGVTIPSEWFGKTGSLALGLSRAEMDAQLLEQARIAGVNIREETNAAGLMIQNQRVVGINLRDRHGSEKEVGATFTIDATGRTRSLARRVENLTFEKAPARFVAFKTHLRGAGIGDNSCEIYSYRGGYGGCNRVEGDLYNLCFIASSDDTKRLGSNAESVMREVVFTNRRAKEAMRKADIAKPWLAVPIERFGRGDLVPANGLITVGDAAAFIDPFTGSGILLALESSKIASVAVVKAIKNRQEFDEFAVEYRINYAAAFDRRLSVCSMLRYAAFIPFLGDATIALLSLSVGLRRRVARATRFNAASDV